MLKSQDVGVFTVSIDTSKERSKMEPAERFSQEMRDRLRKITKENGWKRESEMLLKQKSFSSEFISAFHTTWIVSGHHIRSQLCNDILLARLLCHILPKYNGGDIKLFRGENIDRWRKKSIGFCWTTSKDTARMFGRGLNSVPNGGLLLTCHCKADWIISGPNNHSNHLGESEYTVNPLKILNVKILEQFDPI